MCRLFGMHAGAQPVPATFWLIDAPDSLSRQSRRNPDGAGIGWFDGTGEPAIDKQPLAAFQDPEFATAAHDLASTTFVAHVRYATTGAHTLANTHPFQQDGRIFAHNGVVQGLPELDHRLAELGVADLVAGQTDSERIFALITAETRLNGGDVRAGIAAAVGWIAANLPVFSVNFVPTTATDLWALRYPAGDELYLLDRREPASSAGLDARTARIHVQSAGLADRPCVIVATEPMDDDRLWRPLAAGEFVHVDAAMGTTSVILLPDPPARTLTVADLHVG